MADHEWAPFRTDEDGVLWDVCFGCGIKLSAKDPNAAYRTPCPGRDHQGADRFRISGHLQPFEIPGAAAPEPPTEPPAKPPIEPQGLRVPEGFRRLERVEVWIDSSTGQLAVLAEPDDVWPERVDDDSDHPHNCDAMGCGWSHVVGLAQIEGSEEESDDIEAQLAKARGETFDASLSLLDRLEAQYVFDEGEQMPNPPTEGDMMLANLGFVRGQLVDVSGGQSGHVAGCSRMGMILVSTSSERLWFKPSQLTVKKPRRGTPEHPCENCGQTTQGSFNERGFQRCECCGYPSQ